MTTRSTSRDSHTRRIGERRRLTSRVVALLWAVAVSVGMFQMGFTAHNAMKNSRLDLHVSSERFAISLQVSEEKSELSSSTTSEVEAQNVAEGETEQEERNEDEDEDEDEGYKERSNGEPPEEEKFHWNGSFDPVSEYLLPVVDWSRGAVPEPKVELFDPEQCKTLELSTEPPKKRKPTNSACDGYDGVLHIQHTDYGGASGTTFFQFMIGMLQWADMHNYKPWVHMNNYTWPVWDEKVHGQGPGVRFSMRGGAYINDAFSEKDWTHSPFPGDPIVPRDRYNQKFEFRGTGIWEHYFEPVSDFAPGDKSCIDKPYLRMSHENIVPGLHANAPWAPRGWRYGGPEYLMAHGEVLYADWYVPFRKYAAKTTKKYIRFNEEIQRRAACAFENPEHSLGMHIRHGDKWTNRELIPTSRFLEYAQAFVEQGGKAIYLATDSALVVDQIMRDWPKGVSSHIVQQPGMEALSKDGKAAFDLGLSAHRANAEALTDILALSKCTFLLHGLSALSESAMYLNPDLVNRAVNLEDLVFDEGGISVAHWKKQILPQGGLIMR